MRAWTHFRIAFLALGAIVGQGPSARADDGYPSSRITLVVPFAAGGPTDVVARIVGDEMSRTLNQQVIIENVNGAGGTIGMTRVADAKPDGYTIGMGNLGTQAAAGSFYPELKYDPLKSFQPISLVSNTAEVIVARSNYPAKTLTEFIADLKRDDKKVSFGHAGVGSISHVAGVVFARQLGIDPTMVAYRGTGPALNDLLNGQIVFMIDQALNVIPQIKAGTVKAYAVAAPTRIASIPDVPTAKEAGMDYSFSAWNALFAPKGIPPEVTKKLVDAVNVALNSPALVEKFHNLGSSEPAAKERGPEALQSLVEHETTRIRTALGPGATTAAEKSAVDKK